MGKKLGVICILLGTALILSALFLYGYNRYENKKSGDYADTVLKQMEERVKSKEPTVPEAPSPEPTTVPEAPSLVIDGYGYIASIQIPDLGIELPVMADWSYEKMRMAPCRQFGSSRTDDLVIAAHNYDSFFGRLKDLNSGARIIVTDVDGTVNTYELDHLETLAPTAVEAVQYSGYALVLYTCTYGGQTRVAAFCSRVS
ncbi:MAG: sortase [Eubacteriales bacterium]|nr:sortase [Eubacteriales bacterium]